MKKIAEVSRFYKMVMSDFAGKKVFTIDHFKDGPNGKQAAKLRLCGCGQVEITEDEYREAKGLKPKDTK